MKRIRNANPLNRRSLSGGRPRWSRTRIASGILPLAVGLSMLAAAPSLASPTRVQAPATTANGVATHAVSLGAQKKTLAYWTRQRRESAKAPSIVHKVVRGRPGTFHPGKPGRVSGGRPPIIRPVGGAARPDTALGYPFPYTSFNVNPEEYSNWPYDVNGKIFFTNNGANYMCSGTSVASYHGTKEEDEVWTAGHCVSNTSLNSPGVWDSNAEFIPAYNGAAKNPAPYGVFVVTRMATVTTFINHGDISEDEGAMEVSTNSRGQTLGEAVGWDGFAWNFPAAENFTAFGYPAAAPYTGNLMVEDISSTGGSYSWPGGAGQPLIGIGNPMTGGSSGGAWDVDWTPSNPGYIDGHNDYKFFSQPNAMYSPYQDTLSNRVRCFGASSC
ncbi:MAG TPA: hypothetical protein VHZ03_00905 [Trebonia sp.]|jgi:hypothetical protein|nr:hypothetical protein [Trebonia sp.]